MTTCRHCERSIREENGVWIDPEASFDDAVWRECCDAHDTFIADHEPVVICAYPAYDCTGVLKLATAWFFQTGDQWMAVADEDEAEWFEDAMDGRNTPNWPTPRTYPIDQRPPTGRLVYRDATGAEVTE